MSRVAAEMHALAYLALIQMIGYLLSLTIISNRLQRMQRLRSIFVPHLPGASIVHICTSNFVKIEGGV
jgi:hypothetical protein